MPNGWDEFLEKAKRQAALEEPQALQALWTEFLQRIQKSPRAEVLQVLVNAVQKAPLEQRASAALVVASLLAPLEFPPEWEQPRLRVVEALVGVMASLSLDDPGSMLNLVELSSDAHHLILGAGAIFFEVRHLWLTCRREDLRAIANLCDLGLTQMVLALRKELAKRADRPLDGKILDARIQVDAALDRYAQAARAFNSAVGEVVFKFLDLRLGNAEA